MANLIRSSKYLAWRWWREAIFARWRVWRAKARFERRVVEKRIEGVHCQFLIANPTGEAWYGATDDHQSLELRFVRERMLRSGMTIFEVGGHHGHDTMALASWVGPEGRVIVFEPVPENAEVIRQNCELNGLGNVEVVQAAVGATPGSGRISGQSNGKIVGGRSGQGIDIDVTTLDIYCTKNNVYPNLVKIDVEGYEVDVLAGASQVLSRRPQLQIEVHADQLPDFGHKPEDIWSFLDPTNYEVWVQRHDLEQPVPATAAHLPPNSSMLPGRSHLYLVDRELSAAA